MTGGRNIRRAVKICLELLLLAMVLLGAVSAVRYGFDRYYRNAYPMKYEELIDSACREKELDRALVYAVVRTESGFNPEAVSNVGAKGLMQMMPDAYDWVRMRKGLAGEADHDDLFDPETNIEYGTSMLKILLDEFGTVAVSYTHLSGQIVVFTSLFSILSVFGWIFLLSHLGYL